MLASNSALLIDAYCSALRTPCGAAEREPRLNANVREL